MSILQVILKRPDTSAPFYYESDEYRLIEDTISEYGQQAVRDDVIVFFQSDLSDDRLTLTRTVYFSSDEARDNFLNGHKALFPSFIQQRDDYCQKHNHIMEFKFF